MEKYILLNGNLYFLMKIYILLNGNLYIIEYFEVKYIVFVLNIWILLLIIYCD